MLMSRIHFDPCLSVLQITLKNKDIIFLLCTTLNYNHLQLSCIQGQTNSFIPLNFHVYQDPSITRNEGRKVCGGY